MPYNLCMYSNSLTPAVTESLLPSPSLTVYYDGACPVCSREIAVYQRQAGSEVCAWVDASSCPESALGDGLTREAALARFHVRRSDGVLIGGMRGFATLWRALPRFAWAGRIALVGPIPVLLEAAYELFLRVRPLWQITRTTPTSPALPTAPYLEDRP